MLTVVASILSALVAAGAAWIAATQVEQSRAKREQQKAFREFQRSVCEQLLTTWKDAVSIVNSRAGPFAPSEWMQDMNGVMQSCVDLKTRIDPQDVELTTLANEWLSSIIRLLGPDENNAARDHFLKVGGDLRRILNERLRDLH